MSARSMTGFARVRKLLADGELVVSIKSVNHRGLDMHFHITPELDPYEMALRNAVKARVARGHLQIHATLHRTVDGSGATLNMPLLRAYLAAFERAQKEFGLAGEPDLNVAFRVEGMFTSDALTEIDSGTARALMAAAEEALDALNRFREREGAAIVKELRHRRGSIMELVERMEEVRAGLTPAFQQRLKQRLTELPGGAILEPQRLAQEAALLADRSDIAEELCRLRMHAWQLEELLNSSGEIGKKLDFLLQEMNRETNTILSKTGGLGELGLSLTDLALAAKAEIDKIREQSLNLE